MAATEVAQTLAEHGATLRHPLEVIIFQNEEGGTVGSMALTTGLNDEDLARAATGASTIREGIRRIGGNPDRLGDAVRRPGAIAAYLELHIEQGGLLDAEGIVCNVIPGRVATSLEIRDLDASVIDDLYREVRREEQGIEQATGTTFAFTQTSDTAPAPTDVLIRRVIDESAAALGLTRRSMPSGAGHDAQEMARLGPVGMQPA